jgi:GTP pyrophosphokinase
MHEHAELGVAAHWAYKEAKAHDPELQRRIVSMRHWLEHAGDGDETSSFLAASAAEHDLAPTASMC